MKKLNRNQELNEFLKNLISSSLDNLKATNEYTYRKQREAQIDEMLATNLTRSEKDMVDDVLFELGAAAEHETETLYLQGLKDCVWLLKSLGVLA